MHTVVETPAYLDAAKAARMSSAERDEAVRMLAADPRAGELIVGSGGCRKVRLAGKGKGKSGGYRLITYFAYDGAPVFLLTVFSKGERADLSQSERNALAALTGRLLSSLSARAVDPQRRTTP